MSSRESYPAASLADTQIEKLGAMLHTEANRFYLFPECLVAAHHPIHTALSEFLQGHGRMSKNQTIRKPHQGQLCQEPRVPSPISAATHRDWNQTRHRPATLWATCLRRLIYQRSTSQKDQLLTTREWSKRCWGDIRCNEHLHITLSSSSTSGGNWPLTNSYCRLWFSHRRPWRRCPAEPCPVIPAVQCR